jgi:hypothetical protein
MDMKKQENAQILVLLAVALVAVLAITALAVDGSMIYKVRRDNQTTADSTALSAAIASKAGTICNDTIRNTAINNAISYANTQEGITLANNSTSPSRVEATCSADNKTMDIKIRITTNTPTTFAKMISRTQLTTMVESTTRVTFGSGTFAGGGGLVTLGTTCDANGGIYALGNGRIYIKKGGIFSSSCYKATGSSQILSTSDPIYYTGKGATQFTVGSLTEYTGSNGIIFDGTAPVFIMIDSDLNPPAVLQYNATTNTPSASIPQAQWPTPTTTSWQTLTIPVMATSSCPGPVQTPTFDYHSITINPGTYPNGIDQGSGALTLNPGVYCIAAGQSVTFDQATVTANNTIFYFQGAGNFTTGGSVGISMNDSSIYLTNGNFNIPNDSYFTANDFTIYIKQGNFTLNNGAQNVVMSAPTCDDSSCGVGPAIKGVLLYMDKNNTGTLNIDNGNGAHQLKGTMFAPNALATFSGGTTTNAINVQLVVKRVEANSGAVLNMDTTSAVLYSGGGSASVELLK